jgi:hypothetical protein
MTEEWTPPTHWCQKCLADPNDGQGFYHIETCQSSPEDCPMKRRFTREDYERVSSFTKEDYERVSKRVDELWEELNGKLKGMTDDQYY